MVQGSLPSLKLAPENGWLEYCFPIGDAYFQGRTVSFREGRGHYITNLNFMHYYYRGKSHNITIDLHPQVGSCHWWVGFHPGFPTISRHGPSRSSTVSIRFNVPVVLI